MSIATISAYAIGGLVALSAATLLLPRHVSVERSAKVNAAPETILTLAASNTGYQAFNPYAAADPDLKIDMFGPEAGVGSGFHFDGKDGKGSQTVAAISADSVIYHIDMGAMGQPKQSITTTPSSDGTTVTWRINSDMGFNPVFRVFGLFMDGMMGPVFERGLANLDKATA